jgi:hypothetical protein
VTCSCKSHVFRKRVRRVIVSGKKWRIFEGCWRNFQKWVGVKCSEVKCSEVKWSEDLEWNVCIIIHL